MQYCTFDIFLVKISLELKLAPAPDLFYSICMMCNGRFIWEILYGAHMDVPRWVPDESLLQNPHRSHMGCPYRTHIITHLGPIWVPYSLLAGSGPRRVDVLP